MCSVCLNISRRRLVGRPLSSHKKFEIQADTHTHSKTRMATGADDDGDDDDDDDDDQDDDCDETDTVLSRSDLDRKIGSLDVEWILDNSCQPHSSVSFRRTHTHTHT